MVEESVCIPGVNFTNILRAAFTCKDPKSAKKLLYLTVFFLLLGSLRVKAARRIFGEIDTCFLPIVTLIFLRGGCGGEGNLCWSTKIHKNLDFFLLE